MEGMGDEIVPVALGHDGHEELPGERRPGVDAGALDVDIGPDQLPAELGCEFRGGESHACPRRRLYSLV